MMRLLGHAVVTVAVASLLCISEIAAGQAAQPDERRKLVGVWELVSLQDIRSNGDVLDWMGSKPSGILTYSPEGRMALQIMRDPFPAAGSMWSREGRVLLPSASANDLRDALSGYYAYFGTWEVDERAHTVTHHVRASLRSGEVGAHYVRPFEIAGEQLVLRYPVTAADGHGLACSSGDEASGSRDMRSTKDVVDHHIKCFFEFDLEGILSDYAPDAVLFTPDGPLKGVDAIRPLIQAMLAEFRKPGMTFHMKQLSVDGDFAYGLWSAETADNVYEMGTDTHVVRDGKIVAQSFAGQIKPKR